MLFSTPSQFAVLALLLVAGWLFGLASSSGGRKWRERYEAERTAHARYREEVAADLKTREARLRELEAERDRYRAAPPVAGAAAATGTAASGQGSGWFGWGRDNLSRIRGVDERTERALHDRGIKTYRAIEALTAEDERALEDDLHLCQGTIHNEGWREQAAMLREGRDEEHRGRWN